MYSVVIVCTVSSLICFGGGTTQTSNISTEEARKLLNNFKTTFKEILYSLDHTFEQLKFRDDKLRDLLQDWSYGNNLIGPKTMESNGGAVYTRWGRTVCPKETQLVYKGYAGGSHFTHKGGAAEYLCLPEIPQTTASFTVAAPAFVYGAEYERTWNTGRLKKNDDVPCAVCRSLTRSAHLMIPARHQCFDGWHLEYWGYLMAGFATHDAASQYVCVDVDSEGVEGGSSDNNGKLLYQVIAKCGSLPCPPYTDNQVINCVVCTK